MCVEVRMCYIIVVFLRQCIGETRVQQLDVHIICVYVYTR